MLVVCEALCDLWRLVGVGDDFTIEEAAGGLLFLSWICAKVGVGNKAGFSLFGLKWLLGLKCGLVGGLVCSGVTGLLVVVLVWVGSGSSDVELMDT